MPQGGNSFLLPTPPKLSGAFSDHQADIQAIQDYLQQAHSILNQSIQAHQNRLNVIQQTGASNPPNVTGFSASGRQGLFSLVWNRIANVDGYVIIEATDSGMKQLVGRYNVSDGQQCSFQIPVGNVSIQRYFQVFAYQGNHYGSPSNAISATSLAFTTPESAPATPPIAPPQPLIIPVRSGPNL